MGLCIGSFLNVCIYRIPKEESISFPASHCTNCGYELKVYDLIPVFSYLFLKGKCRSCSEKISMQYPLIEMINAIIYVALYIKFGFTLEFLKYIVFASLLIVIGMIDLKTTYVYLETTIVGVVFGIIFFIAEWITSKSLPIDYILGAALGFLIIFAIVKLTGGMGEGDIEIATVMGLFLGVKHTLFALFVAFVFGGIVGAIILASKSKGRKDEIAFGPHLVIGAITAVFIGTTVVNWYISMY